MVEGEDLKRTDLHWLWNAHIHTYAYISTKSKFKNDIFKMLHAPIRQEKNLLCINYQLSVTHTKNTPYITRFDRKKMTSGIKS